MARATTSGWRRTAAALAIAVWSCSNPAGLEHASVDVGSVAVDPSAPTLIVGGSVPLTAQVLDLSGAPLPGVAVMWTVKDPQIASVTASGVVTALAIGSTQVAASAGGHSGLATITVQRPPVASVAVRPGQVEALAGAQAQLTAVAYDAGGAALGDRAIVWSTSNDRVATVDASGLVTAVGAGSATISATSETKSGTATITVSEGAVATVAITPPTLAMIVGQRGPLATTIRNASGATVTGRAVVWSSSNTGVATVDASGVVQAVGAGDATITATSEGVAGSAAVTVANAPVRSVDLSTTTVALDVGMTSLVTATVTDVNGAVVTDRAIAWTSSNPAVATVSASGVVSGVAPGTATITATVEGKSASASVTVTPPSVASVLVSPAAKSMTVGQTTVLSATIKDARGTTLTDRVVAWSSSNPAVATVSQAGVVTAVAAGTVTISATSGGQSGAAAITVTAPTPAPVASVLVQPPTLAIVVGLTGTLSATPRDASGAALTGRVVTWTSSNDAVATVSATGVVTAKALGTATITATSEGKSGSAAVTVVPPPVATVTVLPATVTLSVGTTTGLSATLKDANGAVLTNRTIAWSTSNGAVASVSQAGVVTAVGPGTAVITATSEGKSGSSTITVPVPPVASVALQPTAVTVTAGNTTQIIATLKDAAGNVLTGRVVTWSSDLEAIATVSSTGLVTAKSPGSATITATSEGKTATATVTVVAGPAAMVIVTPGTVSVRVGGGVQLTATAYDANGNWVTGRAFTWTSSNGAIATVSSSGFVTTKRTGKVTITATMDSNSGSSAVTVTQ